MPDLPAGATAADLLLDSDVRVRRTILTFINDKQFDPATPLADNDRVTFLSPLSGG
ncbi:MAG: MoaD/ThiS family protein [Planctomycetaceae bacterium]